MKEGTVKTSSLLLPKLRTLREFGESVTDADVDNFDELVKAGFINYEPEQEEQIGEAITEKRICIAEGTVGTELDVTIAPEVQTEAPSELFTAMTETVVDPAIAPVAQKEKKK